MHKRDEKKNPKSTSFSSKIFPDLNEIILQIKNTEQNRRQRNSKCMIGNWPPLTAPFFISLVIYSRENENSWTLNLILYLINLTRKFSATMLILFILFSFIACGTVLSLTVQDNQFESQFKSNSLNWYWILLIYLYMRGKTSCVCVFLCVKKILQCNHLLSIDLPIRTIIKNAENPAKIGESVYLC